MTGEWLEGERPPSQMPSSALILASQYALLRSASVLDMCADMACVWLPVQGSHQSMWTRVCDTEFAFVLVVVVCVWLERSCE